MPELDNVIANLELLPLKLNEKKNSKIGDRQRDLARKFHQAGVLSRNGLEADSFRKPFSVKVDDTAAFDTAPSFAEDCCAKTGHESARKENLRSRRV